MISKSSGQLILLSAPSGAGKTTLVHELLQREPNLRFSISYTTRSPRPAEVDGEDYFFVSEAKFSEMVNEGAFLEHARVFDNAYGTGRGHVEDLLRQGHSVLLEIDWQGARQIRTVIPSAVSIFILPPSVDELLHRLRTRASDSETVIARRFADAIADIRHWTEFDFAIINEKLDRAVEELHAVIDGNGDLSRTWQPNLIARTREILNSAAGR